MSEQHRWTIRELQFIRNNLQMTDRELAAELGVRRWQVIGARKQYGIIRWHKLPPILKCSVPGCDSKHHAKGMCKPHYERDLRRRNVATPPLRVGYLVQRVAAAVAASPGILKREVVRTMSYDPEECRSDVYHAIKRGIQSGLLREHVVGRKRGSRTTLWPVDAMEAADD